MFTPTTCHMLHVMCHVSLVMCDLSHVTCNVSLFSLQSCEAYQWKVCYQQGLPDLLLLYIDSHLDIWIACIPGTVKTVNRLSHLILQHQLYYFYPFSAISVQFCIFQPLPASYRNCQSFPAKPVISSHSLPIPVSSNNLQQFLGIFVNSINFHPFPAISSYFQHFVAISSHF